ncbi:hypothetical protein EDD69_1293 [Thermolongibacillus altinsuensis]|uniref:N-acetyltransferase domain-containing protein n=1 Tax=Thermolongibacillus altinsuensis TaxID=575256 RepID=A0A4R1Q7A6_9BACL|nr:GNAT family N-acetyltransferase [Thermolongibacillus altinsuensis]TCL43364.1 hypothetical protein EDD69_1293 [Thermolongibacillus altinsuensis]
MVSHTLEVRYGRVEDYILDFIEIANSLYSDDPNWIPLRKEEILQQLGPTDSYLKRGERSIFIVYRNEKPVARALTSFDSESSGLFETPTGFFSHFESINDLEVVRELFKYITNWFEKRGVVTIMGPMTPKISDTRGLLVEGEGRPLFGMPYTKKYYVDLLKNIGFSESMNMFEYIIKLQPPYEKLKTVSKFVKKKIPNLNIRPLDLPNLKEDMKKIIEVYNEAWKENWGFIPLNAKEFYEAFLQIVPYYQPDYCLIAEIEGQLVGFQMIMPDLNNNSDLNVFRAFFIGVIPQYRNCGVEGLLLSEVLNNLAIKYQIDYIHVAWVLESNKKWRKEIEKIAGKSNIRLKKYVILQKNTV